MATDKLNCNIDSELKAALVAMAKEKKVAQGELIKLLFDNFKLDEQENLSKFNFSEDEQNEINQAISHTGSYEEIAKAGILHRVRYVNSIAQKESNFESMTDEELKAKPVKGVAKYRIEQTVQRIIEHNNNPQTKQDDKICINQTMLFKLTGSNRKAIKQYLEDEQEFLQAHHNQHNLNDSSNRKGANYDFKVILGLD